MESRYRQPRGVYTQEAVAISNQHVPFWTSGQKRLMGDPQLEPRMMQTVFDCNVMKRLVNVRQQFSSGTHLIKKSKMFFFIQSKTK